MCVFLWLIYIQPVYRWQAHVNQPLSAKTFTVISQQADSRMSSVVYELNGIEAERQGQYQNVNKMEKN